MVSPTSLWRCFLILVIIFRRQGLLGSSELLLESWFSKETYTSLFKKSEYKKLLGRPKAETA